ncbi:MAG: hypothetical protein AVDCRST_MAG77-1113, partial [uncultured Chloroflexi bacterium]
GERRRRDRDRHPRANRRHDQCNDNSRVVARSGVVRGRWRGRGVDGGLCPGVIPRSRL